MRKLITILLLASSFIWAQADMKRHSISVGYGFGTIYDFGAFLAAPFDHESKSYGQVSIGYGYKVNSWFETGAILNYEIATPAHILTLMAVAKFNWVNKEYFRLYSNLDFGVTRCLNEYENFKWLPMGQLSLAGIELGKDFAFFFETLGWGQSGLFYTGLKYAF